jgi:hypothetical protein
MLYQKMVMFSRFECSRIDVTSDELGSVGFVGGWEI